MTNSIKMKDYIQLEIEKDLSLLLRIECELLCKKKTKAFWKPPNRKWGV